MIVKNYRQVTPEPATEAPGVTVRWMITEKDGAPNFALRVFEVEPGYATPYHSHPWEHEVFIVRGDCLVRTADGEKAATAGDFVYVPPNEEHQFVNPSESPLEFICVVPKEGEPSG